MPIENSTDEDVTVHVATPSTPPVTYPRPFPGPGFEAFLGGGIGIFAVGVVSGQTTTAAIGALILTASVLGALAWRRRATRPGAGELELSADPSSSTMITTIYPVSGSGGTSADPKGFQGASAWIYKDVPGQTAVFIARVEFDTQNIEGNGKVYYTSNGSGNFVPFDVDLANVTVLLQGSVGDYEVVLQ